MSAPNGHAQKDHIPASGPPPTEAGVLQVQAKRVKELVAALEVCPFDQSQIDWRVMNTTKNQQPVRGQVVPYADQRAYTDRLNALFTPAGWTRKYTIHTIANFVATSSAFFSSSTFPCAAPPADMTCFVSLTTSPSRPGMDCSALAIAASAFLRRIRRVSSKSINS